MAHIYKRADKYRIQYTDEAGKRRDTRGLSTMSATKAEAARLEDAVTQIRHGTVSRVDLRVQDAGRRPLADHLRDWESDLLARQRNPEYVKLAVSRVRKVFAACRGGRGVLFLNEIDAPEVQRIIAGAMAGGGTEQTAAHFVTSLKGFSKWLYKNERTAADYLRSLCKPTVMNARKRVPFAPEDLEKVINHLESMPRGAGLRFAIRNVDRAWLYRIAACTGFRRRTLASLTPASFNLASPEAATVTAAASSTKNKRPKINPLPAAMVEPLRQWLASKEPKRPLWNIPNSIAIVLRGDFKRAGVELPNDGCMRDFHSLRNTAVTGWARSGVNIRAVQELAGHCTPALTARYAAADDGDMRAAVNATPPLALPSNTSPD